MGTGTKTNNTGSVKKSGTIAHNIKAFTKTHQKKVKVSIAGLMETGMSVNGQIICSMEKAFSFGMMIDSISETGKII